MNFSSRSTSPSEIFQGTTIRTVERVRGGQRSQTKDFVAEETPIALIYNGVSFAVMMATPSNLVDFARGLSISEGLVTHLDQIHSIMVVELLEGIQIHVTVEPSARAAALGRHPARLLPGRGSCGICGTRELEDAVRQPPG